MVIKASAKGLVQKRPASQDIGIISKEEDALVMILFPKQTWDIIEDVAERMGLTSSEVLAAAVGKINDMLQEIENGS